MKKLLLFLLLALPVWGQQTEMTLESNQVKGGNTAQGLGPITGNKDFTGAVTFKTLNNCQIVDGTNYTTIQAAITAAGSSGCVIIQPGYAGTDGYSNASGIPVLDLRLGTNSFGIWSAIQASSPVLDGSGNTIPDGNDVVTRARGAADNHVQANPETTTSSTSIPGAGVITITVAANKLYNQASITLDRWTANQETLAKASSGCPSSPPSGTFCPWTAGTSPLTIVINPTLSHASTPYTVDNWGTLFLDGQTWALRDAGDLSNVLVVKELRSGATIGFVLQTNAGTKLFQFEPSDSIPRYYGKNNSGYIFYGSSGGTGTCGLFRYRNNETDQTQLASIDTCNSGRFSFGALLMSGAAPTILTHFNTSGDSIAANNGTASFVITVGSGTGTSTGALTLPTAATGWTCWLTNQSRADLIQQTGSGTTSATFTNFGTTFAATNWTNGDTLRGGCTAN